MWGKGLLFLWVVMCVSAVKYRPILLQISSGTSYCNSDKLFSRFDLSEVPQFGAMCNIPVPRNNQLESLLETNVVPILCMGLYDVSLRLCKSASDNTLPFMDIFPPSSDKFSKLFSTLHDSDEFSSLSMFCSSTAKNFTITESSSNVTAFWWNVLNKQFQDENTCKTICRTNENNRVQPLCSYILWSNGVYLNHQKNVAESQSTDIGEYQANEIVPDKKIDLMKKVAEESTANVNIPPSFVPTIEIMSSATSPPLAPKPPALQDMESVVHNTSILAVSVSGKSEQPITVQQIGEEPAVAKASQDTIGNLSETKSSVKTDSTGTLKNKEVKKDQSTNKTVVPVPQEIPKPLAAGVDQNPKTGETNAAPVVTIPNPKSIKTADNIVDGDFSFEVTPEGVVLDQPIMADKDLQQFSDEEVEDGDGDDVDMEPESPVKTSPNRTGPSKAGVSKPNSSAGDQGAAEPDKVYGEVERQIIIEDHFIEAEDSHFFTYFLCIAVLTIMAYLVFHNKKKLVALAVEGRRTRGSRHRPNSSNYSKLDCSLEEALVSKTTASVTHVLY